jgi:hypothetical protein
MKYLLLGTLICLSTLAIGQNTKCRKFKNGKFKITDPVTGVYLIERKGKTQIEYGENSKLKAEFEVIWLSKCTYTLELKKILENPNNIQFPKNLVLKVQILETTKNSYTQKTTSESLEIYIESEMIKVKDF